MSGREPWRDAAYRPVSVVGMAELRAKPDSYGAAPELKWVAVADLVIDTSYQRDITREGVSNIRKIAENFSWAKFGAVIAAPCGSKFAVIDGQHRATAAALLGIRDVPAQVVPLSRAEQAGAFNAINAVITRVHTLHAFAAACAAGDADALAVQDAAAAGGVTVSRYPRERSKLAPGETVSVAALKRALKRHGRATLVRALKCLTRPAHNRQGAVNAVSIRAMALVLGDNASLAEHPRLFDAMDTLPAREFADWIDSSSGGPEVVSISYEIADALREQLGKLAGQRGRA